ncbi:S1/P1 nuclease [Bradyrhizobium barranii]|uniref:S1/P1 nuclease n=1 Tax=Bradyrhizobium barranii TaxID=2992140 RepID=UPI0024B251E7|nr:S1/P1 nuclease [Bradyrhizobium barranii]WFT97010.1 S1/P1 nuclease [Bradyrhizobium barranii]
MFETSDLGKAASWAFASFLFLVSSNVPLLAWGQEGHSIIAEIADQNLSASAKSRVAALLGQNGSLASISSWADDVRDDRPETYNWHFVDVPLAADNYDPSRDCLDSSRGDCAINAIERNRKTLLDPAASPKDKKEALMFLVHFIGDIHQPLHAVGDYRGANDYHVKFFVDPQKRSKQDTNLHAVWDSGLIRATVWDWGAYVRRLQDNWLPGKDLKKLSEGTVVDWMLEAHKAARDTAFKAAVNADLGEDYLALSLPLVDRQLASAGLRLARVLNETFIDSSPQCSTLRNHPLSMNQPLNVGELKLQLIDYKCSGQYDREVADTLASAQAYINMRAGGPNHPAIILDIDETSLSNWPEIIANDFGFIPSGACSLVGPCGDLAWELSAQSLVIAPTLRLFNQAKAKNVKVFFVTGRRDTANLREATEKNLRAVGYDGWEALLMRPPIGTDTFPNAQAFKTAKRAEISKTFTIIANIGDQQSDLVGGYAERVWRVPNPFYYVP